MGSIGLLGLVVIALSSVLLTDRAAFFPGVYSLIPSVGAALVIFSGSFADSASSGVNALLSEKLLVFLGKVSNTLFFFSVSIFFCFKPYLCL